MPKKAKELKAIEVKRLTTPGRHAVGGTPGLYLAINDTGAKSWIQRSTIGSKRRHIGLGPYPEVSLGVARDLAREMRRKISSGIDPVEEREVERKALLAEQKHGLTFKDAFEQYFQEKLDGELRNAKNAKQWGSTLTTYAYPAIGSMPVSQIQVEDVLAVLRPIWTRKNETASRVRQRIEKVLDWSKVTGHRTGENPALWKGNLQQLLPAPAKVQKVQGHPALALDDISTWFRLLRMREGMAARSLEFLTLTASRSGEIRGALWEEINLDKAIWIIPNERMKAGREHRVPLSSMATELLSKLPRMMDSPYVFPSPKNAEMSDMTISAVMRRIQKDEEKSGRTGFLDTRSRRPGVPHGLRSTFRDWAAERTDHPREMAEMALAHNVGSEVERAYRRGDMLEKRRKMMGDWANFVTT